MNGSTAAGAIDNPALGGVLGGCAGLAVWFAGWAVHAVSAPSLPAAEDPLFWMTGLSPLWLGAIGVLFAERRAERQANQALRSDVVRSEADGTRHEAIRRAVLETSFDAVLVVVGEIIVEVNAPAVTLLGYGADALKGMRVSQLLPDTPVNDTVLDTPSHTPNPGAALEWRTRGRHANGTTFLVDVRMARSEPSVQTYTIREPHSRRLEVALAEADGKKVAEQRRRALALQQIGHGLRIHVEDLLEQLEESGGNADRLATEVGLLGDVLLAHADELEQLVMWERSTSSPTVAPIDPGEIVAQVAAELRPLARLRNDRLEIRAKMDLGVVVTDPRQLVCAIRTLVAHELRRLRDGRVTVEMSREPGRGTDWLAVFVEHAGRTLDAREVERVQSAFDASGDVHPPADELLDLALVQRLARSMGGHLAVESLTGAGTTLSLRIPMDAAKVRAVPLRPPPPMESPLPEPVAPRPRGLLAPTFTGPTLAPKGALPPWISPARGAPLDPLAQELASPARDPHGSQAPSFTPKPLVNPGTAR